MQKCDKYIPRKNVSGYKTEKSSFFERKNKIFFLYL